EIIYTRGTTESLNLVASSLGRLRLRENDEVVVSAMEHHSNIVPWQMICGQTGAKLRVIPMNERGELLLDEYDKILAGGRVKIVAVVHLSNSLGTVNEIKRIAEMAHGVGALMFADGAQWVAHYPTDLQDLGVDFYAFSGHKLFGPTGVGVLYGRRELLEKMPPYQGGGDMIESVTFEKTTYAPLPNKFEAGTPDIAGVIGLGAAIEYVQSIDLNAVHVHEQALLDHATEQLRQIPGLRIIGTARNKGSVVSFVLENPPIASIDIGTALDQRGVAVRTGHHCCMPVMARMNIAATTRASFAMYNTRGDVDALVAGLREIVAKAAKKPAAAAKSAKQEVEYPKAVADSPTTAAEELAGDFDLLGEREARSQYVIDLGERLPNYFDLLKKVTPRVPGCMSEVYLVARKAPGSSDTLEFVADADAAIVRGLIALLERLFSGQRAADILAFDVESFFRRIGLDQFVSSQRRNGLAGMIARIRREAEGLK
ncbi:MAG TPA: aminotransferase class V-fold PLP-dependent enzyme, partial [Tepidisphaeraceae bacterium]|nr:aminotransferase class V-fold PLP-dependent enzyme [Tepidisphaeraceae bacterium]